MKKIAMMLSFLLLLTHPAMAGDKHYHPSVTPAEKALAHILKVDYEDRKIFDYMMSLPDRDKKRDYKYKDLFTQPLLDAWRKAYLSIPPEDGEGNRQVPVSFITCGQENTSQYYYATVRSTENEAYIAMAWTLDEDPLAERTPFRMVKEKGKWKLDGARCPDWDGFNGDFHYTR